MSILKSHLGIFFLFRFTFHGCCFSTHVPLSTNLKLFSSLKKTEMIDPFVILQNELQVSFRIQMISLCKFLFLSKFTASFKNFQNLLRNKRTNKSPEFRLLFAARWHTERAMIEQCVKRFLSRCVLNAKMWNVLYKNHDTFLCH